MRFLTLHARGQALVETAIALPVFLLVMFGVVWSLQIGVLGERVEMVARYGGMVSARINPYQQYSLYAVYSAAGGAPLASPCVAPPTAIVDNGGPLAAPAAQSQPFWQALSGSEAAFAACDKFVAASSNLSAPMLLGRSTISVEAATAVPDALQPMLGPQRQRLANLNQFQSPDMSTLVGCYAELQAAFEHSVDPTTDSSSTSVPDVIGTPATGPLALACGG